MILTGRRVSTDEALRIGLITRVIPADRWPDGVNELAKEMGKLAPLSLRAARQCINAASDGGLQEGLALERTLNLECFQSQDFQEGLAAFREKREPFFRGRSRV